MTKCIGLWIDHSRAVIVMLNREGQTIEEIESGVGGHTSFRGAPHPKTPYSAQYQQADDQLDRQFMEHLNKFYDIVINRIHNADTLLIFGPGEAKLELEKRLAHERLGSKITGIETADKMTDRQIAAKVRGYFAAVRA
jgi:ribosomal protein S11